MDVWEEKFENDYKSNDQCVLFLVSPPGAGKTYLLERKIAPYEEERQVVFVRIDCSNDELVERAMENILLDKFPRDGQKSVLVAGIFYLLSD